MAAARNEKVACLLNDTADICRTAPSGMPLHLPHDEASFVEDSREIDPDHPLTWLTPTPPLSPRSNAAFPSSNFQAMVLDTMVLPLIPLCKSDIAERLHEDNFSSASTTASSVPADSVDPYASPNTLDLSDLIGPAVTEGVSQMKATPLGYVPALGFAPPSPRCGVEGPPAVRIQNKENSISMSHRFHSSAEASGQLSYDMRCFTKSRKYAGMLSFITDNTVHVGGKVHYAVVFDSGEMSSADGVGFNFCARLPCTQNIQRITSIFLNKGGRVCLRANKEIMKLDCGVKRLELGDRIEMFIDLNSSTVEFNVRSAGGQRCSKARVEFRTLFQQMFGRPNEAFNLYSGYLACAVKQAGVTIHLED